MIVLSRVGCVILVLFCNLFIQAQDEQDSIDWVGEYVLPRVGETFELDDKTASMPYLSLPILVTRSDGGSLKGVKHGDRATFQADQVIRLGDARSYYENELKSNPDQMEALLYLSIYFEHAEEYSKSEAIARRAIEVDDENPHTFRRLGNALNGMRKYRESNEAYKKALMIDPDYANCLNNTASNLVMLEEFNESLSYYNRAIKIDSSPLAWIGRAQCNMYLQNYREAIRDAEFGVKKSTEDEKCQSIAHLMLAQVLYFTTPEYRNLERSLNHYEQSYAASPFVAESDFNVVILICKELGNETKKKFFEEGLADFRRKHELEDFLP